MFLLTNIYGFQRFLKAADWFFANKMLRRETINFYFIFVFYISNALYVAFKFKVFLLEFSFLAIKDFTL